MGDLQIVSSTGQVLATTVDGQPFDVHAMWLRDACACDRCRRPVSNERLVDVGTIAADIAIEGADIRGEVLLVGLSDGHLVQIDADWLARHLTTSDMRSDPAAGLHLWDASDRGAILWSEYDEVRDVPAERVGWLELLSTHGIAATARHQPGEAGVREAAALIGPIRPTNYGEVWTVDASVSPATAVDSERSLQVHTDLPYRDATPGLQVMIVESDRIEGGDSTFVDGFAAAEFVRATDPGAWHLLTNIDFVYPFLRDDFAVHGRAPLIGLHTSGAYSEVRRAPDLVGVPYVEAADTPELYRAVRVWNELLDGGQFERQLTLQSTDVVVWNNHRLLHGRTAFALGAHGRRTLSGCYVDGDDLRSALALAMRTPNG